MSDYPEYEPPDDKPKGRSLFFLAAWARVLANPSVASFNVILDDPRAGFWRALRWLFLCSAGGAFALMMVVQFLLEGGFHLEVVKMALFYSLYFAAILTIHVAAFTACLHLIARLLLRGTGTYGELLYSLAAFIPALLFIEVIVSLLTYQPLFFTAIRLYRLLLILLAVQAVHRMTWWKTLGAVVAAVVIMQHLGLAAFFF